MATSASQLLFCSTQCLQFGKGFWAGSLTLLWSRDEVVQQGGAQRRMGSRDGGGLGGVAQAEPRAGRPEEEEAFSSCLLGDAAETLQPSLKTQFGEQQLCI